MVRWAPVDAFEGKGESRQVGGPGGGPIEGDALDAGLRDAVAFHASLA